MTETPTTSWLLSAMSARGSLDLHEYRSRLGDCGVLARHHDVAAPRPAPPARRRAQEGSRSRAVSRSCAPRLEPRRGPRVGGGHRAEARLEVLRQQLDGGGLGLEREVVADDLRLGRSDRGPPDVSSPKISTARRDPSAAARLDFRLESTWSKPSSAAIRAAVPPRTASVRRIVPHPSCDRRHLELPRAAPTATARTAASAHQTATARGRVRVGDRAEEEGHCGRALRRGPRRSLVSEIVTLAADLCGLFDRTQGPPRCAASLRQGRPLSEIPPRTKNSSSRPTSSSIRARLLVLDRGQHAERLPSASREVD